MDVATLKAKIKSKQLPSYLIFSGPEWKVQELYIQQIAKVTNKEIRRIDSVSDIYGKLKNKSFTSGSYIYIVRDDKDLIQNEKLQNNLETGILGENILIHLITNIDKRTKFYKRYTSDIIEFERLSESMLKKYILKEINLSERNLTLLIACCENDYGRILLEIDKIKRYVNYLGPAPMYDGVFEKLLQDGTIYEPPYDAIFDLVDAILDRKVNLSFDLLQQSYEIGESTLVILSVLYSTTKVVLQIQSYDGDNLSRATGLTGWQIKNAKKHVGKYSEKELNYILRLIQKIESGIKTGRIEDEIAVPYLLAKIL